MSAEKSNSIIRRLPDLVACAAAVFMLVYVPAVFRNAFFDINRVKVDVILDASPVFLLLLLISFVLSRRRPMLGKEVRLLSVPLIVFSLAAVISSARHAFDSSVLLGEDGRRCGLLFLLACAGLYFVIAMRRSDSNVVCAFAVFTAAAIAVLGAINSVGIDPFGFYTRMQKGQEYLFLSTIGNVDFFGCYLALLLPVAASRWIIAEKKPAACTYLFSCICIALGIAASRSDTALLSVQVGMLALLACSGDSYVKMAKVLLLWALSFAVYPLMYSRFLRVQFFLPLSGLFLAICQRPFALALCAALVSGSILCMMAHRKGCAVPGIKKLSMAFVAAAAILILLLFVLILYFTVFANDAQIGSLSAYLRFDDHWGTRRGFVYRRACRALADFSPLDLLFGRGVDRTLHILKPYFDDPSMLAQGLFNDAHCQPLQFLLTTGWVGAGSVIVFYLLLLVSLSSKISADRRLSGFFASILAYAPIALLNVSQPILIATFMAVSGVAVSSIQYSVTKEGNP